MLSMAEARSSSGGVAMLCTSGFAADGSRSHTMGSVGVTHIPKQLRRFQPNLLNDEDQQLHIVGCALRGAKSAIYDCLD